MCDILCVISPRTPSLFTPASLALSKTTLLRAACHLCCQKHIQTPSDANAAQSLTLADINEMPLFVSFKGTGESLGFIWALLFKHDNTTQAETHRCK